jgi:hypothetical protein
MSVNTETLSSWADKNIHSETVPNQTAGGKGKQSAIKSVKKYKRTDKRVKIGLDEYVVYEGSRGGKYVRRNGKYKSLISLGFKY